MSSTPIPRAMSNASFSAAGRTPRSVGTWAVASSSVVEMSWGRGYCVRGGVVIEGGAVDAILGCFGIRGSSRMARFAFRSNTVRMTSTPTPGSPVRGSTSGRPIMALFDLIGRRWALRIVWELREGDATFRDLAHRCDDVSSSVLRDRLRDLTVAGIVERGTGLSPHRRRPRAHGVASSTRAVVTAVGCARIRI